ncbi:protein Niban-like isoform X1 [Scleropages formosus]|uniref:Protein Niban-like n=1 Tax=Scleropages formosus TaxID=113540 RepID=A0A8C9REC6_SCLFO|nr:protein Niban-like isoform X1 [Scleropages formosus]
MGASSSSLLDDSRSNYIRGRTEAELKNFSPHYRRQYLVAFFSQLQDEVEQHKTSQPQLLKRRVPSEDSEVLYKENVLYFDDSRKWKERYLVVRANYSLECHDSSESFAKGGPPRQKLEPAGGAVLTSEEKYATLVDKAFPDPSGAGSKEEPPAPLVAVPGPFPVYLHLPYYRDAYFSFDQEDRHGRFVSVLTDCVRHQSHDFLKKATCEVQAFLKAIQFYRQEKGHYESWDMLIGSDVQVLANLVMEELLPSLQTELLPRLKGKKVEKKRLWFVTVEAAYLLVQEQLSEGLAALKEECRTEAKQQEGLIRANMDQIINSRAFLMDKLQATVSEPALKYCAENVQPYLASILEELMGPISLGFQEARLHCEREMDSLCKQVQEEGAISNLREVLDSLGRDGLQDCYQHVEVLCVQLQELRNRFKFSNALYLVQCAQISIQQLMENAAYTFELLLQAALKENTANPSAAVEKAKRRVLKQYDYDSNTVRKKIFQEALVDITLPALQRSLAPSCKPELQTFDQYIFADHTNFIQVENVYEDILLQTLESEISKVVKEAASMKKHNLFVDSTDLPFVSQASLSESRTPPKSPSSGPAEASLSGSRTPSSPLLGNGDLETQQQMDSPSPGEADHVNVASPVQQNDISSPSPVTTALEDPVLVTEASPSTEAPPVDTDIITGSVAAPRVTCVGQQRVTDRAVYLKSSPDTKGRAPISLDSSAGINDDGAVAPGPCVELRSDGSAPTCVASDSNTALPESVSEMEDDLEAELKEGGVGPGDLAAEVTESGTVTSETPTDLGDSSVIAASSPYDPSAQVPEGNADQTEDFVDSGAASASTSTTGDGGEAGAVSLSGSPNGGDASAGADSDREPGEPAVTFGRSASACESEGGATAPDVEVSQGVGSSSQDNLEEEEPSPDSVREIRDLLVEVIEVEELVYKNPPSDQP